MRRERNHFDCQAPARTVLDDILHRSKSLNMKSAMLFIPRVVRKKSY